MAKRRNQNRAVDNAREMDRVLKILARAERLCESGLHLDSALKKIGVSRKLFEAYCNRFAPPVNGGETLTASPITKSVVPIFHENAASELEQVGSGVILRIEDELFVLSAAHVFDRREGSALFMPAESHVAQMTGTTMHSPPENGDARKNDRFDLAYMRLDSSWHHQLHEDTTPVELEDCDFRDEAYTGNLYSFCGYPWRKTKRKGHRFEGDLTTFTGHLLPRDVFRSLGYSRSFHVLIRLRRKRTDSTRHGPKSPAPHPEGISGGAVLSWPLTYKDRLDTPSLKIAAIAHSYHERQHCMGATRIGFYLAAIARNNPKLTGAIDEACERACAPAPHASTSDGNKMHVVGIGWYERDSYERCRQIFDDGDEIPDTFEEWILSATSTESALISQGMTTVRARIDPEEFMMWCSERGFEKVDHSARLAYCNEIALRAST